MSREIKTYTAQEFRRGEWETVFTKLPDGSKKPKTARISAEHAELITMDAESLAAQSGGRSTSMFRYVDLGQPKKKEVEKKEVDNKPKLADLRIEYPEIKATSVKDFLAKIEESKK